MTDMQQLHSHCKRDPVLSGKIGTGNSILIQFRRTYHPDCRNNELKLLCKQSLAAQPKKDRKRCVEADHSRGNQNRQFLHFWLLYMG